MSICKLVNEILYFYRDFEFVKPIIYIKIYYSVWLNVYFEKIDNFRIITIYTRRKNEINTCVDRIKLFKKNIVDNSNGK